MAKSPFYKIILKKNNVDMTNYVTKFRFEDCVNEDNLLSLDLEGIDNNFIDDISSMKGDNIIFQYGIIGGEKTGNRLAEIKSIEVDYGQGIHMKIKAHDGGFAIKKHTSNKVYEDMTSSEIVEKIASEFGFGTEIEATTEPYTVPQANKTYFELIKKLAKKEGFDFFITDNIIKFKSRDLSKKAKKLYEYNNGAGNVLSFRPKYEDKGSSNKISSPGMDDSKLSSFNSIANGNGMKETGLGKKLIRFDVNGNMLDDLTESGMTVVKPENNKNLVQKQTDKELEDSLLENMTASLRLVFDLSVSIEDIVTIANVAKEHAGNWYIHKKTDIIDTGGAITVLDISRNATNNKGAGKGDPSNINKSTGEKEANLSKTIKVRKYDVNGNQIN